MEAMAPEALGRSHLKAKSCILSRLAAARLSCTCTANGPKQVRLRVVAGQDGSRGIQFSKQSLPPWTMADGRLRNLRDFAATAAAMEQTPDLKFWKVGDNPYESQGKFLIWNRQSYDALVSLIETGVTKGYRRFILLGTAGAGKSVFAIRWMLKLAAEGCQVVIKQADNLYLLDFSVDKSHPNVSGPYGERDSPIVAALYNPDTWLIIDGKQESRINAMCKILQASSTKPTGFEEFGKAMSACKLYLPVWSKEEIVSFLNDFEPHRMEYRDMHVNDSASVLKLYAQIGGVPRYVLNELKAEEGRRRVSAALRELSGNVEKAMQVLAGGYEPDVSDRMVHIFVRGGNYFDPIYGFATPQVKRSFIGQVEMASDVRIRMWLKATIHDSSLGTVWGNCFEVLVHKVMVQGGKVRIKRVEEGRSGKIFRLVIPPSSKQVLRDVKDLKKMVGPGMYVTPLVDNFPVADGFKGTTIVQAFKRQSGSHGYNGNGLVKIDKFLQLPRYRIWSCVPPELFEKTGFQKYQGLKNKAAILKVAKKCVQYVVEIEYEMPPLSDA